MIFFKKNVTFHVVSMLYIQSLLKVFLVDIVCEHNMNFYFYDLINASTKRE